MQRIIQFVIDTRRKPLFSVSVIRYDVLCYFRMEKSPDADADVGCQSILHILASPLTHRRRHPLSTSRTHWVAVKDKEWYQKKNIMVLSLTYTLNFLKSSGASASLDDSDDG